MYSLRVGESLWWDEKDPTQLEWDSFLDHSDTPSVRIELENFDLKAPRADLVAIRPIQRGDELLINYHDHKDHVYKAAPYSRRRSLNQAPISD
jgi:hypothetical protein